MGKYASEVVKQAQAWIGCKESNGTHKKIIDIYNKQKPLPVGYKVKYTDAWCATFVSAVFVQLGYTDIMPTECSCPRMITLFKKKGIWVEDESRIPNPGDIIFYDWDDGASKVAEDNTGAPEHVGIVEKVSNGIITVIEGNYSNSVKRRKISLNGRYLRGYGVPKYDSDIPEDATPLVVTEQPKGVTVANGEKIAVSVKVTGEDLKYQWYYTSSGDTTKFYKSSIVTDTYTTTMDDTRAGRKIYCEITDKYGQKVTTDIFTLSMAKNPEEETTVTITLNLLKKGDKGNQVKAVQRILRTMGYYNSSVDGIFGTQTHASVRSFQKKNGLEGDGIVGEKTWSKLLGVN